MANSNGSDEAVWGAIAIAIIFFSAPVLLYLYFSGVGVLISRQPLDIGHPEWAAVCNYWTPFSYTSRTVGPYNFCPRTINVVTPNGG